eukprot:TRINITY_DN22040_c0_g1_i1.p1 TRINITY_DN22040_c0_g1~~TRINITY_DN22040_c0_g1_i1.p1  ORF type:complete len:290 (+),score=79.49 TRINITY_DN22040_c0_g1_i1:188-1057(+)
MASPVRKAVRVGGDGTDGHTGTEGEFNRLKQRRNNAATNLSPAAALALRSKMEEQDLSSASEATSESSDGGDDIFEEEVKKGSSITAGPLLQALTSKWKAYTEKMVVQLIESGADLDERLEEPWDIGLSRLKQTIGATPLHFAARRGLVEACEALVECKASVDSQTATGVSSLMVAVMFSNLEIAQLLVDAKASALLQEACGMTVTDLAILEGDPQMVELLLRREREEEQSNEEEAIQGAVAAGADPSLLPPLQNAKGLSMRDEDVLSALVPRQSEQQANSKSAFDIFG